MKVEISPGQRYLLGLLQRKLLATVESYARLANPTDEKPIVNQDPLDLELRRLKDKIKRISARQKRFIGEIMHGNGNNTISKENYLKALGLVTKEASHKINTKPVERRRRTTANPRFSHEAIQAKKALEPYLKRLEPRVRREMILYS